ncbi:MULTISPECIES: DUF4062 domain-containing protein [Asticcacaulis]|uniref:DUF4062 domain-containing protein n=1 Tax=Asticcacaulis TaxID=76890 RepID=UPI001AE59A13|nr:MULTISPECIES: DUF4062 domain-containing protein [Asticcacaulis]MBP2157723.1 tetratricopeptide (TPR) repeat protein [Asticcacaulis solisilvae]MDR6798768.1 tetratricopeptide (TPR) repeat protein [Asticcacaulis sp. BE141]
MPKQITQYRIFVGSPGGLQAERKKFRDRLQKCSSDHGLARDVLFHPVGWEDTIGGVGRPQALINDDLRTCDFAVFVFHDRWGSKTGNSDKCGTEEEWELAEQLYETAQIRNIALFFKAVDPGKCADPGEQLTPVLRFRQKIIDSKRYLFRDYQTLEEFADVLDSHLAKWLEMHDAKGNSSALADVPPSDLPRLSQADPGFAFWMSEAKKLLPPDGNAAEAALIFASRAVAVAKTKLEWAEAEHLHGRALCETGALTEGMAAFTGIVERFSDSNEPEEQIWRAKALGNKGITLGRLARSEEELNAYNEVIVRYGASSDPTLREQVCKVLFNKACMYGQAKNSNEAVSVFDDLIANFGSSSEANLQSIVAKSFVNKAVALRHLDRNDEAISACDSMIARFGLTTDSSFDEVFARAAANKGLALQKLGRQKEAIKVYSEAIVRFKNTKDDGAKEMIKAIRKFKSRR